jgi:hypothetical protein
VILSLLLLQQLQLYNSVMHDDDVQEGEEEQQQEHLLMSLNEAKRMQSKSHNHRHTNP